MHGWAPEVIDAIGQPGADPDGYLSVFYTQTPESKDAGRKSLARMSSRSDDRDSSVTWETRLAQYDAVCDWGTPNHSALQRTQAIQKPVFVATGDSDPMIRPRYSHLLAGLLTDVRIKIYPDAGHGFLFQHHTEFSSDVHSFLHTWCNVDPDDRVGTRSPAARADLTGAHNGINNPK